MGGSDNRPIVQLGTRPTTHRARS